jgi:hypothetical protein
MTPFRPDSKTIYRKYCTNCDNDDPNTFSIISPRLIKCTSCGNVYDAVSEKAERSVYESQKKS